MSTDNQGSFALVLHSHIPYVLSHGLWVNGLNWLTEAVAESYLPLLEVLDRLVSEGISPQITVGLTPILLEQLADSEFPTLFESYLKTQLDFVLQNEAEFQRAGSPHKRGLALYWRDFYNHSMKLYNEVYERDLISQFRRLQDEGHITLLAGSATHPYLPLIANDTGVSAQIQLGIERYEHHFQRKPKGFWLPECGYRPEGDWAPIRELQSYANSSYRRGIESFLSEHHIEYTFLNHAGMSANEEVPSVNFASNVSTRGDIEIADTIPTNSTILLGTDKQVTAFVRDPYTAAQVWSRELGYPGHQNYLEFHKKHYPGMLRYWRISLDKSSLVNKNLYEPSLAADQIKRHAADFVELVKSSLAKQGKLSQEAPLLTAMYDTELFGHWWHEGPQFIYEVLRKLHGTHEVKVTTCAAYLANSPTTTSQQVSEGSWGRGGGHDVWLNSRNLWVMELLYKCENLFKAVLLKFGRDAEYKPLLDALAREMMLMQSSDWQFAITNYSSADYAEERILQHHKQFNVLVGFLHKSAAKELLSNAEQLQLDQIILDDRCFQKIDLTSWAR